MYNNSEVGWLTAQNLAEISTATVKICNINDATTCVNVAIALGTRGQKVTPG
ncbi:hypothetical protein NDI47_11445 [Microcoleus vaginatus GB1-A2]|uniref:hypothetical protein n=1 Tax=Microcoleus vaginatus TaxID=119532 RepID=UPI0016820614|nr:hypothetical protein [Microcoleus sp. FACHB-61]